MMHLNKRLVAMLLLATCFTTAASAASILGSGLLGVNNGNAGHDSVVNVGVGSDGPSSAGNIVDLNLLGGGNSSTGNINVSSGGSGGSTGGLIDGDIDLLGGNGNVVSADIDLNGDDVIGLNVGSGSNGGGIGVCVDIFGDCDTPAGNGGGTPGTPGTTPGNGINVADLSNGLDAACFAPDDRRALTLVAMGFNPGAWMRATNVTVITVRPCPELRSRIAAAIARGGLRQAVQNDARISASLSRSHRDGGDVLAVVQKGTTVNVFVL